MPNHFVLITCEHGGHGIPPEFQYLFSGHETVLPTHRGYDQGALVMAEELAAALEAPLVSSAISRLLVDLNRSIGHPRLYSDATRKAGASIQREILQRYYTPYRTAAEEIACAAIEQGHRVIHIASHSFVPELGAGVRNADIGLLYDPGRADEVDFCRRWRASLMERAPQLKVRMNYPYTGKSDGFTTFLRKRFSPSSYAGIELEVNQQYVRQGGRPWRTMRTSVSETLRDTVAGFERGAGAD